DIVGRDVHEPRTDGRARAGEIAGGVGIDPFGGRLVGLGAIDVRVRRAVDDRPRLQPPDRGERRVRVGEVALRQVPCRDLVAEPLRGRDDLVAEHARRSGDQQPHGIAISQLSPTMKRKARGWPTSRDTFTLRPSSDDSMRPLSSCTEALASRIECSISARSTWQPSPTAVYGPM